MRLPDVRGTQAQTAMEYAVVVAVVAAALVAMQIYMKRGVSGRLRSAADSIGEQYAPGGTTYTYTTTISSNTKTEAKLRILKNQALTDGRTGDVSVLDTTTTIGGTGDSTSRTGSETVSALGTDLWN